MRQQLQRLAKHVALVRVAGHVGVDDFGRHIPQPCGDFLRGHFNNLHRNGVLFQLAPPGAILQRQHRDLMAALFQSTRPAACGLFSAAQSKVVQEDDNFHMISMLFIRTRHGTKLLNPAN